MSLVLCQLCCFLGLCEGAVVFVLWPLGEQAQGPADVPEATKEANGGAWVWTQQPGSRDRAAWPHLANTALGQRIAIRGRSHPGGAQKWQVGEFPIFGQCQEHES